MIAKPGITKIVRAALRGIERAQGDYAKWSGGAWLGHAPEYWTTVHVAREIAKTTGPASVTLECGSREALKGAGAVGRGQLSRKIRAEGRVDIMLWRAGDGTPRTPVEVKSRVDGIRSLKSDLNRLRKMLQRKPETSSFEFGLMAFFLAERGRKELSAAEAVAQRLAKLGAEARELLGERCSVSLKSTPVRSKGNAAWAGAVLILRRPESTGR